MPNIKRILVGLLIVVGFSLMAQPARAGFSVDLNVVNEPNVSNALTGVYATVQGVALDNNTIQFTVTPNDALWGAGNKVKVFGFGFNPDTSLTGALTYHLPSGWSSTGTGNMDGFGSFLSRVSDTGSQDDQDPLVFTVDTANAFGSGAALEGAFLNSNSKGHTFAAHMRGFNFGGKTSAFFTDGNQNPPGSVPAPPAIILLATALPVIGLRRYLRRKAD